jgi:hypothetical protein
LSLCMEILFVFQEYHFLLRYPRLVIWALDVEIKNNPVNLSAPA